MLKMKKSFFILQPENTYSIVKSADGSRINPKIWEWILLKLYVNQLINYYNLLLNNKYLYFPQFKL